MAISSRGIGAKNRPEGREWVVEGDIGVFHMASQGLKDVCRRRRDLRHLWVDCRVAKVRTPAETQAPHTMVQTGDEARRHLRQATGITWVWSRQHLQEESGVAHRACHGTRL